jgi:hypothetical protein
VPDCAATTVYHQFQPPGRTRQGIVPQWSDQLPLHGLAKWVAAEQGDVDVATARLEGVQGQRTGRVRPDELGAKHLPGSLHDGFEI